LVVKSENATVSAAAAADHADIYAFDFCQLWKLLLLLLLQQQPIKQIG
jgi:hypothetical protein